MNGGSFCGLERWTNCKILNYEEICVVVCHRTKNGSAMKNFKWLYMIPNFYEGEEPKHGRKK